MEETKKENKRISLKIPKSEKLKTNKGTATAGLQRDVKKASKKVVQVVDKFTTIIT